MKDNYVKIMYGLHTNLLALRALEINVAVTFSAFRRRAKFTQFVRLSSFRQPHVPERPGWHRYLGFYTVYICSR